MPLVTVVIPTYNRRPLLMEAVESVRAQTFADWELIVVDDGSTDGSAEAMEALGDPRIRVLRRPHTGNMAAVRNAGIRMGSGEWIAFLDSDDAWRADKLQAHLDAHRADPSARWSWSGRTMMDAEGATLPDDRFAEWKPYGGHILAPLLAAEAKIAFPTVFVARALLDEAGGLDETLAFSEDYDLELRLAARAECICIPQPLVRVRLHLGNTGRGRAEADAAFIQVYHNFAARHGSPEVRRVCRRQQAFYAQALARKHVAARAWRHAAGAVLLSLRTHPAGTAAWLGSALAGRLGLRTPAAG